MASVLVKLALLSVAIGAAVADKSSPVLELNPNNFLDIVRQYKHVLVEFFSNDCGRCRSFSPQFEAAAETLREYIAKNELEKPREKLLLLAKVDCVAYKPVCKKFRVTGVPKLKWFTKGEFDDDYTYVLDKQHVVDFVIGHLKR